jgi:dTDP-4-dehydrorhamnose reductase
MKKILISGGNGNFAQAILKNNKNFKIFAPNKKQMNILKYNTVANYIKKTKAEVFIHSAALTTPMSRHKLEIEQSIDTNIIGSANVAKACHLYNIKLIYISTNFVYPGLKGNYKETDSLMPVNEYGWSKLGGECAAKLCKNHLILRLCMTDDNYPHEIAYDNYITSFMRKTDAAKKVLKLINKSGIINLGGPTQTAYKFAKKYNKSVQRGLMKKKMFKLLGRNTSINVTKLKKYNV